MMAWIKLGAALALTALTGCGSGGKSELRDFTLSNLRKTVSGSERAVQDPTKSLTREMIEANPNGLLLIRQPSVNGVATVSPAAVNGSKITWISPDGKSVTTQAGYIIATRALGEDLQALEVRGFSAAMRSNGTYTREMEFLNGRNETVREHYTCQLEREGAQTITILDRSYRTTLIKDVCRNDSRIFENRYWVDAEGKLRRSRQWISKSVGYLQTESLS
ncbi:MAG: hypothetical protein CSA72_10840 [Rhodobacterales bacterium]|nr:MAG: hypothetical protein CSA72_10840 [Rhodobacterales bacterium]